MKGIKRFFLGLLRFVLILIGMPAVLFSVRLVWSGVDLFRKSGDQTAAAFFLVLGLALLASGIFVLRRAFGIRIN